MLLTERAIAFANLGRLWQASTIDFAEAIAVSDPEVLSDLQDLLEQEVGDLKRLLEVTIDPDTDTFKGKAEQRLSLAKSQIYGFTISPDQMIYKLVSPSANFGETDEEWLEAIEFAATGKILKCKPGNTQCGGKCQDGLKNCFHGMTPEQKKKAQAAVRKAKKSLAIEVKKTPNDAADKLAKDSKTKDFISLVISGKSDKQVRQALGLTQEEVLTMSASIRSALNVRSDQKLKDRLIEVYGKPKAVDSVEAKIFDGHAIGVPSRIDQSSLENALDSISTAGAAARVKAFRAFTNKHEVQAAFWDDSSPVGYAQQAKTIANSVKNTSFINDPRYRDWLAASEGIVLADGDKSIKIDRNHPEFPRAIATAVIPVAGANGHTIEIADHVFVNLKKGKSGTFAPDTRDLGAAVKTAITAHEFELPMHSISSIALDPDAATLSTYLHEMGHQVHFKGDRPPKPPDSKTLTDYADSHNDEWFAEHFAAWMLDGESYKAFDPIGHKFIEDTLATATRNKK